jgi:hypothetical protein
MDHILKQQQNELSTIDALLLLNLIIIHQKARHASYVSSFITGSYASFSRPNQSICQFILEHSMSLRLM